MIAERCTVTTLKVPAKLRLSVQVAEAEAGGISDGDYADDSEFTGDGEPDSDVDFDSDQAEEEAPSAERPPVGRRAARSAPALTTRTTERAPETTPHRYRTRRAEPASSMQEGLRPIIFNH